MKRSAPKNVAASVLARLKTLATKEGVALEYVLNRYAAERTLYRLSKSPHRDRVVLKGATLLARRRTRPRSSAEKPGKSEFT